MRSSKKRSRSSQNRPRTLGNIINRVFDSSGPEGKVRGTPQQIIEKYLMLARDAQLSNDRVAAENFQQHAEHYTRMLAEATKEMAAEQEARQQHFQQNGGNGSQTGNPNGNPNGNGNPSGNREYREREPYRERDDRRDRDFRDPGSDDQPVVEIIDFDAPAADTHLVETPEARRREEPAQEPRREVGNREGGNREGGNRDRNDRRDRNFRRDRDDRPRSDAAAPAATELPSFITGAAPAEPVKAAPQPEAPAAEKPRRAPRKPKADKPETAE
jgi:hypothetical protein